MLNKKHMGSSFDDFLEEEGILEESEEMAIKSVIAYEIQKKMEQEHLSDTQVAKALETSRSSLSRLLDPKNTSITLKTMSKAVKFLGKKLQISIA
jgi:predicted XRE-type DNA-binding protein